MAIDVKLTLQDQATRVYNQFVGNVQKSSGTIESTMKSVGTAIGAAFSVGAIVSFAKMAAEAEAGTAALSMALKNAGENSATATQAFLDQADMLKKKTAIDDDEIKRVQSLTIAMTGNAQAAYRLTPAILDLAVGMGISTEQAAKMFSKSLEGSEGLKKAGIEIGKTANEMDRLGAIAQAVEKKWGGAAAAFKNTDAGKIKDISIAMEDLEKSVGKVFLGILGPALPGIAFMLDKIAWGFEKIMGIVKMFVSILMTSLVAPLAAVEHQMNMLGLTSSNVFQNLMVSGMRQTTEAALGVTRGVKEATSAAVNLGTGIKQTTTEIEPMLSKIHVSFASLVPVMKTISAVFKTFSVDVKNTSSGIKESLAADHKAVVDSAMEYAFSMQIIVQSITGPVKDAVASMFNNGEAIGKNFFKAIAQNFISLAQTAIAAYTAIGIAMGVPTFGASIPASLAIAAGATAALEVANQVISRFHDGGTMAQNGSRIPLGTDERHAILKVGETVLPTKPGESYGGTVMNATININAPGTPVQLVMNALNEVARQIGANTLGEVKINQRSQIAFG